MRKLELVLTLIGCELAFMATFFAFFNINIMELF